MSRDLETPGPDQTLYYSTTRDSGPMKRLRKSRRNSISYVRKRNVGVYDGANISSSNIIRRFNVLEIYH